MASGWQFCPMRLVDTHSGTHSAFAARNIVAPPRSPAALHSTIVAAVVMTKMLQHPATLLLIYTACRASQVIADESVNAAKLLLGTRAESAYPHSADVSSIGSVAAGCSQCRDSGNCSVAMNDTLSGVFCGDLRAAASVQPCCCPYYTECRVTSKSSTCKCGGAWPFPAQLAARRHERLSVMQTANETETQVEEEEQLVRDPMDDQMSVSTEILIHLSAYLALFVFAAYVDQWVECFSDFRRNQMVAYGEAVDMKLLRFRQRFGKRRRDAEVETVESDDNLPLLVLQSPAPTSSPEFTFAEEALEVESVSEHVVVVTVPVDAVREVSTNANPPEPPSELQEVPLE